MKKTTLLALVASKAPWQYYNKYKLYLKQLEHPFRKRIDFYYDINLDIKAEEIQAYAAVAFFYHDPLQALYPEVYAYAKRVEAICDSAGIPFINRPDALSNTIKSVQLKLLSEAGFNVAQAFPFTNLDELKHIDASVYPLFLRIDFGHDSQGEFVQGPFANYENIQQAYRAFELNEHKDLAGQVAVQFIETQKQQGYYAKYRCLVTPQRILKSYIYFSDNWYIHSDNSVKATWIENMNRALQDEVPTLEETAFFTRALKALQLDFCAFDYAYKPNGDMVIWEANPHPGFLSMSDAEPLRSRIVDLLSSYYESFLPPLPWHKKLKHNLRQILR